MTCKTHVVAANAVALTLFQPNDIKSVISVMGAATIGGIVCDLDVVTAESHKYVDRFIIFIVLLVFGLLLLEFNYGIGVLKYIDKTSSYFNFAISFLILLAVSFFGIHQPHRSFMHSFFGTAILGGLAYVGIGKLAFPFMIGMLSHIFLDLFNKKGVQIYYPIKNRLSFKLCSSDGLVNNILFVGFIIVIIIKLFNSGTI